MSLHRHHSTASRPRSVEEIVQQAEDFDFSPARPLRQWLRSGKQLLTEATFCEDDGDLQTAYLYLYRNAELILKKLPSHPDYANPMFKAELSTARKAVMKSFQKLEKWQPKINQDYHRYMKAMERRNADMQRARDNVEEDQRHRRSVEPIRRMSLTAPEGAPLSSAFALDPRENQQMALDFAHRELQRREASRGGSLAERYGQSMDIDASREIREAGRRANLHSYDPTTRRQDVSPNAYAYPTVPQRHSYNNTSISPPPPPYTSSYSPQPPLRPSKELISSFPPAIPAKESSSTAPALPSKIHSDLSAAPATKYTFKSTARTEGGTLLRSVFLPPDLRTSFLNLASSNTARNLETCGILCGSLISNALFINHLIIPDQTSTSDTCDTTDAGEIALFDYCDNNQLLVCGWIHTHPTQTCFLSSRDLHTCSGYQVMLPEAIAIVCAPRHTPDWGIFRLTDPPGLPHVLDCRQTGLFHPHAETNLYTDALRPGHVVEGPGMKFEVVDLRMQ